MKNTFYLQFKSPTNGPWNTPTLFLNFFCKTVDLAFSEAFNVAFLSGVGKVHETGGPSHLLEDGQAITASSVVGEAFQSIHCESSRVVVS